MSYVKESVVHSPPPPTLENHDKQKAVVYKTTWEEDLCSSWFESKEGLRGPIGINIIFHPFSYRKDRTTFPYLLLLYDNAHGVWSLLVYDEESTYINGSRTTGFGTRDGYCILGLIGGDGDLIILRYRQPTNQMKEKRGPRGLDTHTPPPSFHE